MYAQAISTGDPQVMMSRHRILVNSLGYMFIYLWNLILPDYGILLPLQVFNALCGAIIVALVFYILVMLTGSSRIALISAIGFGVSNGIWLFSIEAEMVTPPLLQMLAVLSLSVGFALTDLGHRRQIVYTGILTGFAILTYVQNIFLIPIVILAFVLSHNNKSWHKWTMKTLLFIFVTTVFTVIGYSAYFYFIEKDFSMSLYGGQGSGLLYGTISVANVFNGLYTFSHTVLHYPFIPVDMHTRTFWSLASWSSRLGFITFELIIFALIAIPFGVIVYSWRSYPRGYRASILLFLVWSALFAIFALWWVPKDLQFWLPVTAGWWLLFGSVLAHWISNQPKKGPWYVFALLMVSLVAVVNFLGSVMPRQSLSSNSQYLIAISVKEHTTPQDMIIIIDDNRYIPFFSERQTISLLETILNERVSHADDPKPWVFKQLDNQIERVRQGGGKVFLYVEQFDAETLSNFQQIDLTPSDWQRFNVAPGWAVHGAEFVEILK